MTIFALFLCIQASNSCEMYPTMSAPTIYKTLSECQGDAKRIVSYRPPKDGRYTLAPGVWYECRGKRVETWETAK